MRLRDVSEQLREIMETQPESVFGGDSVHALVQDITDVQTVYRPVLSGGKRSDLVPWLAMQFEPFSGLIEPFNVYPGRFWAMQRIHKQSSGLPELVTHVARELPSAAHPLFPDLYVSFSTSAKVDTLIRKSGKEPISLRFFHRGALIQTDRTVLDASLCLPGFAEALPEGDVDDGIPGPVVGEDGTPVLYLGELRFYNQGRTLDRPRLCNFLLNSVATAIVARYVRDLVRKSMTA